MRKFYLIIVCLLLASVGYTQSVFFDDFESGTANWTLTGAWGTTTTQFYSGANSLTDSPSGNYADNVNSTATMATGVDLSSVPSASMSFWAIMSIESGFDYMYVDVSTDDFSTYITIETFDTDAALTPWVQYNYDLGGFTGNANVKVRFRFYTDGGWTQDGMYIDDFDITTSTIDNSPPLIIHTPAAFFEGELSDNVITAEVIDFSGISSTELNYAIDGVPQVAIPGVNISGTTYEYIIPALPAGTWVAYSIFAEDAYATPNNSTSDTAEFIAGNHIIQDNGVVNFYTALGPTSTSAVTDGVAVKISLGNTDLAALCIRNYTDNSNANDDIEVHVWDDNAGLPGADVITPFMVTPEATLSNTSAMTRVDLRPYSADLTALTGTYYIGFIVPAGKAHTTITQPGVFGKSYYYDGSAWVANPGDDYHIRAITTENLDLVGPNIMNNTAPVAYEADLLDQTILATISDDSGVASADLLYTVDGGGPSTVAGVNTTGDEYEFTIPAQAAGAEVLYYIEATDGNATPNTSQSFDYEYIAGIYLANDNATPTAYTVVAFDGLSLPAALVKYDLPGAGDIVGMLIRNYYADDSLINDMQIHVFTDTSDFINNDLMSGTGLLVTPEATAMNTMAYTRVDLRPYTEVQDLWGEVFVGFSVPSGYASLLIGDPLFGTSYYYNGANFVLDGSDYHIRLITSDLAINVDEIMSGAKVFAYPNPMNNSTTIEVDAGQNTDDMYFEMYNILGERVNPTVTKNAYSFEVYKSNLPTGTYIYRVYTNKEIIGDGKLIIE